MTPLAAYLLLFVAVGAGFILVHLVAGKLLRPDRPDAEKETIYECGEPTVGTAWVQFDLRYYVVALLFVIFDVEVAFFFPWAEVFGKANAVANLSDPTTASDYNKAAATVLDLAVKDHRGQSPTTPSIRARHKWEALSKLTPEALTAFHSLSKAQLDWLRNMPEAELGQIHGLPADAFPAMKAQGEALTPLVDKVAADRDAAAASMRQGLTAAGEKADWLPQVAEEGAPRLRNTSLRDLKALPPLLNGAMASQMQRLRPVLQKKHPALLAQADSKASRSQAALAQAASRAEAALAKAFGTPVPDRLSPATMLVYGNLSQEQAEAFRTGALSHSLLHALDTSSQGHNLVPEAREQARSLAWLALVEVLVFFGVLLVGFAYLWRRGDIEWVRGLASPALEPVPEPTAMPVPPAPRELATATTEHHH